MATENQGETSVQCESSKKSESSFYSDLQNMNVIGNVMCLAGCSTAYDKIFEIDEEQLINNQKPESPKKDDENNNEFIIRMANDENNKQSKKCFPSIRKMICTQLRKWNLMKWSDS